jgi:hypothetical protein
MPLIIIHTSSEEQNNLLFSALTELKDFAAKELSCGSKKLDASEISIRIIKSDTNKSIADIEVVIIAHSYSERIKNQDKICMSLKKFIEDRCAPFTVFVWLQLSELGHSVSD